MRADINQDIITAIEEAAADLGTAFYALHRGILVNRGDRAALLDFIGFAITHLNAATARLNSVVTAEAAATRLSAIAEGRQ